VADRPPPVIGQHTREILRQHGFDDDRIERLLAAKVIFEDLWVD
jgi:formyl-CoA transferase